MRLVLAEVRKLWSLPSTWAVLGLLISGSALVGWVLARGGTAPTAGAAALGAVTFTQVIAVAMGTLPAGQEYAAGGQIRTSLRAAPQRSHLFVAKVVVGALLATIGSCAAAAASVAGAGMGGLEFDHTQVGEAARAALHLTAIAAATMGLSLALRGTVAPMAVALVWLLVVGPQLEALAPAIDWLPTREASPVAGVSWVAGLLAVALFRLCGRDA